MKRSKEKPSNSSAKSSSQELERFSHSNKESHQMTLNRPFGESEGVEFESYQIEYHLTVQITNNSLSRKELSLLLEILNYQAVNFGINFTMQLAMYELYFRLLGNKRNSIEIREKYIRKTLSVSEVILQSLKEKEFILDLENNRTLLSPLAKKILQPYLMSQRVYGSRFAHYRPEKFFKIQTVPVDIKFLKRNSNTQPYSGYCKGYGESHPSAHYQKLKPSQEYDGDDRNPIEFEELKLFERCTDPVHVLSDFLILKFEKDIREKK